MIEAYSKRLHEFGGTCVTTQLVTRAAGGNIASARLRARRVTTIAGGVSVKAGRNRHRDAAARFTMASSATDAAHAQVARVIELHAEALQARERFQRSRLHVGMTDGADRTL